MVPRSSGMGYSKVPKCRGVVYLFFIMMALVLCHVLITLTQVHRTEFGFRRRPSTQTTWRSTCHKERANFVYIKNHKSGSETLSAMFRLYGFKRNLSFVLPVGRRNNLGWPWPLDPGMYRPNKTSEYNILCEHSVYDDEFYQSLMPTDTIFTTTLREPFSRFKSAFSYFKVATVLGINSSDPIKTFLESPTMMDNLYKTNKYHRTACIPPGVSMLKNAQAFNLGFPMGFPNNLKHRDQLDNSTFVNTWLTSIKKRFKFVIITELLVESLILWRRMMCWTTKDILHHSRNFGVYKVKNESSRDPELMKVYRQWSSIDVQLYDHYNRTLWQYINEEGPDFQQELDLFKRILQDVTSFCNSVQPGQAMVIGQSRWNREFVYGEDDCKLLRKRLMPQLRDQYDSIPVEVKERQHTGTNC